jgi:hypothetical protein
MSTKDSPTKRFCYPAINIAGMAKCGTTTAWQYLANQADNINVKPACKITKEWCPNNYHTFFECFEDSYNDRGGYHVNGCINPHHNVVLHNLLNPRAVYIAMIRDLPTKLFAAYNFWCFEEIDDNCINGQHAKLGMYRDPIIFDKYIKSREYEYSKSPGRIFDRCKGFNNNYMDHLNNFFHFEIPIIIVPVEAFKDQVKRIEIFINTNLNSSITLDPSKLVEFNVNGIHGNSSHPQNTYAISNYQPMLNSTRDFINSCWTEINEISKLAHFNYSHVGL